MNIIQFIKSLFPKKVNGYKIIAEVDFPSYGHKIVYVLNKKPKFVYHRVDSNTIVGEADGIFYNCYYYEQCGGNPNFGGNYAFGGNKFDIPLDDGNVIHAYGQWWGGVKESAKKYINKELDRNFAYSTIDELKRCYAFCGLDGGIAEDALESLRSKYHGKVYRYDEYRKIIKQHKL